MALLTSKEIRSSFLDFFRKNGHQVVASSSLVPKDDPTLLFTNAGMVQFKKVFLGQEKRPYVRATTAQKCLRVGGKHNDLENVGRTRRHHTFFEMLGNFSFGDYFKSEAIEFAWKYLTSELGLERERLYVTVFKDDDEAIELWKKIAGIPEERIYRLGEKDNFWAMGDTGPCGPCSEILVDQGEHMACGPNCEIGVCDCDRYLEIWNLVFMQFNRSEDGRLTPLPKPSIDTGMGLERISAICQGVYSNFDTDLFTGLINFTCGLCGVEYGSDEEIDTALRVIADHSRAITFMITDGIVPSNDGRGYVLRRLIRRAFRFGRVLGLGDPFLSQVCERLSKEMGDVYPEISQGLDFVKEVVVTEEENFGRTLDRGLGILEDELSRLSSQGIKIVPGEVVFKLYDTFGFPIDIVRDISEKKGFSVDEAGFERLMQEQKERSKAFWSGSGAKDVTHLFKGVLDKDITSTFIGYDTLKGEGRVILLLDPDGREVSLLGASKKGYLICDRTPFYGESGGQVGDKGKVIGPSGRADVVDTLRLNPSLIVHEIDVVEGEIQVEDRCELLVDEELRMATARNHTCTHLLHAALRKVLGEHVKQAGSYVAPDRLRFDFTHVKSLSKKEVLAIEEMVNEAIVRDIRVKKEEMGYEEAIEKGAIGLFEEKYGDKVRVVEIEGVSMELCGGTHLERTGEAGSFYIVTESSVASGIRRIEAVTGLNAISHVRSYRDIVEGLTDLLRCPPFRLLQRVEEMQEEIKRLNKEKEELARGGLFSSSRDIMEEVEEINGIKVLTKLLDISGDMKTLRHIMDGIRDKMGSGVVLLGSRDDSKAYLLLYVSKDLHHRFTAPMLIKEVAKEVGGGGGGREDLAQAGGTRPEGLKKAMERLRELLATK